ncbi:MAG: phosphotransferase [Planctomycetaceae bacterium]
MDQPRLDAIKLSASGLIASMFDSNLSPPQCDCVWPLIDAVWPARSTNAYRDFPREQITLSLVPLSRIGQMEGKSGSLVLIGRFRDRQNRDIPPSHPVVVKTAPISTGKLKEEYGNALTIRPFAYQHKDVFSIPFRKDERGGFDVLWALFSASASLWQEPSLEGTSPDHLKVNDLRNPIHENNVEIASHVLRATYATMQNLHVPFGRRTKRNRRVSGEYEWYLREYGAKWGAEWEPVFGTATAPCTQFAGKDWANPLWLVEELKGVSIDFTIGAVHGDLHPGNIIVTSDHQPRIIDFGWAHDDAHIAKDFVLMECNLRFLFLRPQLASEEVDRMVDWIQWGAETPDRLSSYCKDRCSLILALRDLAQEALGEQTDWNREYLLPLFLVAFGLLRFAPQLGNQQAAILTVLALATHIRDCGVLNVVQGAGHHEL